MRFHEGQGPPDPRCTCGKPIGIVIRPGTHVHPCPVHPEKAVYGR